MAGTARPNHPGGLAPAVAVGGQLSAAKVRRLQRRLWAAAKQSEERRFHALYDRVHGGDVLWEAWERVRANRVGKRVSDRRVLKLVRLWLQAGVMVDGEFQRTVAGTPQGGVISPLLANIYLHVLDTEFTRRGLGELVRYADDGVVLCRTLAQAQAALEAVRDILAGLGLELHPEKAKVVDLRQGREGLDFLGCHFHARMPGRLWEQKRFRQADDYVVWRLRTLMVRKRGRNLRPGQADAWTEQWFNGLGLYRLRGTVRYPKAA